MNQKSFLKELSGIAIPVALQCILQASFGIVDQIMIGQLGSTSVAAVGFSSKFSMLFTCLAASLAGVAGIMISQYLGGNNEQESLRSFNLNLYITLAVAAVFTVLAVSIPRLIMSFYSSDAATIDEAVRYFRIAAFSYFPIAMVSILSVMFRCFDKAKIPLYASVAAAIINTVLNYLLIFGKCSFPKLGVRGAAIATVISSAVSAAIVLILLIRLLNQRDMKWNASAVLTKMKAPEYLAILLPIFFNELLWSLGENVYASIYGHIGTKSSAAMTLTTPVVSLMIGGLSGIAQAAGIMIGKRLGAREYDRAYNDSKKLILAGVIGSLIFSLILVPVSGQYVRIYKVEEDVRVIARNLLLIFAVLAPIKVQNMIVGGGILRSGGNTKIVMLIDIVGTWLIGVPVGILTAFVLHWPVTAVYFFLSLEEAVRLIITIVMFRKKSWMQTI